MLKSCRYVIRFFVLNGLSTIKALFILFLEIYTVSATAQPAPALDPAHPPAAVAHAVINSLSFGCAGNLGSAERIEKWALGQNFSVPRPEISALFPVTGPSKILVRQGFDDIAIVFQRDGLQCRIFARRADVDVARSYFISVLENIKQPGVVVIKQPEREVVQGRKRVLQVGYTLRSETKKPNHPDWLLLITLNRDPNAQFAIIATATYAARE